jgi:hypothetical protein
VRWHPEGLPKKTANRLCVSGKTLIIITLLLLVPLSAQEHKVLNSSYPGEPFEVKQYLERDTVNVVVFWSRHSPSCEKLDLALKRLHRGRDDLAVSLVDVDRKDSAEIDWRSPLVRQYNLRTLPYVYILDGQGAILSQGQEARKEILKMLDGL